MRPGAAHRLSARERQMMDVIWRRGSATAQEVLAGIPDAPSYSAVRATLAILERKGHLRHRVEGTRYIFIPTEPRAKLADSALARLVDTFFQGSAELTVAALLKQQGDRLTPEELARIRRLITDARRSGR